MIMAHDATMARVTPITIPTGNVSIRMLFSNVNLLIYFVLPGSV